MASNVQGRVPTGSQLYTLCDLFFKVHWFALGTHLGRCDYGQSGVHRGDGPGSGAGKWSGGSRGAVPGGCLAHAGAQGAGGSRS